MLLSTYDFPLLLPLWTSKKVSSDSGMPMLSEVVQAQLVQHTTPQNPETLQHYSSA